MCKMEVNSSIFLCPTTTETCECEERFLRKKNCCHEMKAVQRGATGTIKAAATNIDFCLSWLLGSDLCSALEPRSSEPAPPRTLTHLWTRSTMCAISLSEMPGQDSSAKLKAFSSSSMAPTLPPVCLCLSLSCNPETGH